MAFTQTIPFALVIHNHQPIGNRDAIIEKIFQNSYYPFLRKLADYPSVKVNLHYTGFLLDWFEAHHPNIIEVIRKLVASGQVELLGGAYYEPVISVIPDQDTLGQTKLLSERIESLFSYTPNGFWLAERAWEPELPEVLSQSNSLYTLVDDVSFQSSGISEAGCFEPYLAESRGKFVTVFPILKRLRYYIPFKEVSSSIAYLRNAAKLKSKIAVYGDDGEKFGAWPTTFERVYSEGWLDSFFTTLSRNAWVQTVKLSEYLKENPVSKRIYLPASAYSEMMDWSIPVFPRKEKKEKPVPLRGYWRLFLSKYPESARMYAKMVRISNVLHSLFDSEPDTALKELWKGQCNDAYWHGVFGGLYAPFLRRITYEHLIKAQVENEHSTGLAQGEFALTEDRIMGQSEIVFDSKRIGGTISPGQGGSIAELDFKEKYINVLDTLARRPERYHRNIRRLQDKSIVPGQKTKSIHDLARSKEKGLAALLIYDRYPRFSFLDHLVPAKTKLDSFVNQDYREIASLANYAYESEIQKSNHSVSVILTRRCDLVGGSQLKIRKTVRIPFDAPSVFVEYELDLPVSVGNKQESQSTLFVPEINLGSLAEEEFSRNYSRPMKSDDSEAKIVYSTSGVRIRIRSEGARSTWILPVRTVSQSEDGFESILQGISVLPVFPVDINPKNDPFKTTISLDFV
ncbi:MAG: DUF1926 domain-containing protein [Thaumarchaeota archaeon]|nr:DUF1926 domain-containing protein [Nitrososphaerota archaeon]